MAASRLLLVGCGHAHLHLVSHARALTDAGYHVTLLAPDRFDYSGSASAIAAGGCDPENGRIDVSALAHGRVDHVVGMADGVDLESRNVLTDDGVALGWDVVSFNIGSVGRELPEAAADERVVRIKPLADLARLDSLVRRSTVEGGPVVTIVGGGASGVELAAHLSARDDVGLVRLLEAGPAVASSLPAAAGNRLAFLLRRRGVDLRTGTAPVRVAGDHVVLPDGSRLSHDLAVLATGLVPPPLATRADVGGEHGIPVRDTLQHRDHDDVYAAGDCADFLPQRLDKVGVHGVRQGPVLLEGLVARRSNLPAPRYRPQQRMLSILDLGGGTALAAWGSRWWLGRSSLLLKRWIDRRWLARYAS